jgi:hypothetical protein
MAVSKERLARLQEMIRAGRIPNQSFSIYLPKKIPRRYPHPHEVGKGTRRPWPHERRSRDG